MVRECFQLFLECALVVWLVLELDLIEVVHPLLHVDLEMWLELLGSIEL